MKPEEAIEMLKLNRDMIQFNPMTGEVYEPEHLKWRNEDDYRLWLADGVAIEALQKQAPLLPHPISGGYADGHEVYDEWECPGCGKVYDMDGIYGSWKYCPNCGQRIGWGEREESK